MDAGVVPVKSLRRAKTRLGAVLDERARFELAGALVEDTFDTCEESSFLSWWVVAEDEEVLASARRHGFGAIPDPGRGLNGALSVAIAVVASRGATSVTVLPADTPLARREDVVDVVDTGATSDVVLVPARRDGGTNAFHARPPGLMTPRFGPGSLHAHVASAGEARLRCALLELPRLSVDLDTADDVRAFLEEPAAGDTRAGRLLQDLGLTAAGS